MGSGVTSVALAVFAYRLTGSDATVVVGTALMLRILAFLLFSQPAGVLADRLDRKRILIASDLVRFVLLAAFPFLTAVWHVYALIFLVNAATAFFTPTFEATIPEVVGSAHYTRALSLARISVDLEAALGPLLAGALIGGLGVRWAFWFDSLTYLASAALVLGARVPGPERRGEPFSWRAAAGELAHGTRVIFREPALRQALVLHIAEAVAGAVAIVTTVVYVRDVLRQGDVSFAMAMAALGAGSSGAALVMARRGSRADAAADPAGRHAAGHRRARRTLVLGGAALSVALLPGVLRPAFPLLLALWALNGVGQAMIAIPSVTLLAEHTRPDERGRAYAAHFAWTHLFWLGTYPGVGWLARTSGTPLAFSAAGLCCGALALLAAGMRARHDERTEGAR